MSTTRLKPRTSVCDFVSLDDADEETIAEILASRFKLGKPYTYIKDIVISVNPYRKLSLYSSDFVAEYKSTELSNKPPHIYAVADAAFHSMLLFRKDACIVISGETGSGKTVASKYLTQYIASLSPHTDIVRMKNQLILSHPLLESFGNARTLRNNNSSRFGRYMSIAFNLDIVPTGGQVRTYLLEKSRVVKQREGERNFHCFYQLLAGAGDRLMEELQLEKNPSSYRYLGSSSTLASADGNQYEDVLKAMMTLRFSKEDIEGVRKLLAAILHLGNVKISERGGDDHLSAVVDLKQLNKVAGLLDTEVDRLAQALTHRTVAVGNGGVTRTLSALEACCRQDDLAMMLYEKLFQLVVCRVNRALSVNLSAGRPTSVIGLLDFHGFEALETNGFEQFCMNYCNERLQQMFYNLVLKREQQVYQNEGIRWDYIDFRDNKPSCSLIESMVSVLNDECLKPEEERSSMNLMKRFDEKFSENDNYSRPSSNNDNHTHSEHFQITHQAGTVVYSVTEFVSKNKDTELNDIKRVLFNCKLPILKEMFPDGAESDMVTETRPEAGRTVVTTRLRHEISELVNLLESQTPYWIRCIVPNLEKNPKSWDNSLVLNQVRSLSLVETTRLRKAGYSDWMTYERFVWRYKMLDETLWPTNKLSAKEATKQLVSSHKLREMVVFGKTQILFRTQQPIFILEAERQKRLPHLGMIVCRSIKRHYCRQRNHKTKALLTLVTCYRRKFASSWLREVVERFKDCSTLPDYGRSMEWPRPPAAMILAKRLLQRVHLNWWAKMKLLHFSPAQQHQIRLKTITYGFLHGKKPNLQLEEKWLGDELGNRSMNSTATQFTNMMSVYQDVNGDTERLYSSHVTKLNRHLKANRRVLVLCDKHLYHLTSDYQLSKRSMIEVDMITGISISTGNDQAMVIHCVRRFGDCAFYLENNRPASEFLAAIWSVIKHKYKRQLPVKVTDTMKFTRPDQGIDIGSIRLQASRRGKAPAFRKRGDKNVSLTWPGNDKSRQITRI